MLSRIIGGSLASCMCVAQSQPQVQVLFCELQLQDEYGTLSCYRWQRIEKHRAPDHHHIGTIAGETQGSKPIFR
uniref:Putative secreted protein n=1 Tax=Anopheles marajoara TaxID=58244 RepID=A0A2M4CD91_9DIPT